MLVLVPCITVLLASSDFTPIADVDLRVVVPSVSEKLDMINLPSDNGAIRASQQLIFEHSHGWMLYELMLLV
jgi:hypothetical protein